jgi:hypothetical protein
MFYWLNLTSTLIGVKEMSEDQDRSQLITQIQDAKSECEKTEKSESRNKIIRFVVLGLFIAALFMALQ